MTTGIYRIKNIITSECYVGSSTNIETRWKKHQWGLKNNKHPNPKLQNAYNKYGADAFVYNVLDYCENILEREQMFIDSGAFSYNLCLDAKAVMTGKKHSDETKAKMSAAKKGIKRKPFTEETLIKMSKAQKGKKMPEVSAETKAKLSARTKAYWERLKKGGEK